MMDKPVIKNITAEVKEMLGVHELKEKSESESDDAAWLFEDEETLTDEQMNTHLQGWGIECLNKEEGDPSDFISINPTVTNIKLLNLNH